MAVILIIAFIMSEIKTLIRGNDKTHILSILTVSFACDVAGLNVTSAQSDNIAASDDTGKSLPRSQNLLFGKSSTAVYGFATQFVGLREKKPGGHRGCIT